MNMMLAQAYTTAKSAGLKLRVTKLDGVPRKGYKEDDNDYLNVEVVGGYVQKAWLS